MSTGGWITTGQTCSFAPIAGPAEELQIVSAGATPEGDRDDVIKLEIDCRSALPASPAVAGEDELSYVVRYCCARGRTYGRANRDDRLGHLDALAVSLLTGHQKCIDLLLGKVVVVPVEATLEPPVPPLSHSAHGDGNSVLPLAHVLEFFSTDLCDSICRLPDLQREPSPTREQPRLVGDRHVLDSSQHRSRLPGSAGCVPGLWAMWSAIAPRRSPGHPAAAAP